MRPTTWATYRIYAEAQVLPALGHVPLQALTAAHLNRLYADLAEHGRRDGRGGLKPKSVRHVHVLLHKALNDAVRWGLVARNVADAADPPRVPRQERGAWSAEELRAFLDATSEDRLAAMWLLFVTTGMRRSELLGVPWRAVDLEASPGRLAVVQTVVVVDKQPVVVAEAKRRRREVTRDLAAKVGCRRADCNTTPTRVHHTAGALETASQQANPVLERSHDPVLQCRRFYRSP